MNQPSIQKLLDPGIWKILRKKVISNLACCRATGATGVSAAIKKYNSANERDIQSARVKFGGTQAITTTFFYCFARAFVDQLHKSITEPDVLDSVDDEVVEGILSLLQ
jgi:hypothetical protein